MSTAAKIVRYELSNVARSRWLLAYAAFFAVVTDALVRFGGGEKALLSLVNHSYLVPMFTSPTGRLMLLFGVGSLLVGTLIVRRIVTFKG